MRSGGGDGWKKRIGPLKTPGSKKRKGGRKEGRKER